MQAVVSFRGLVEFAPGFAPRPQLRHALVDFDGTLSLIREGWPEVMIPMFLELLPRHAGETDAEVRQFLTDDVMRLNGRQTIYQMIQFAQRVQERGGQPKDPRCYKQEYLRRLDDRIRARLDGLRRGTLAPDDLLVHGARAFLELLRERGLTLHLASGTDEVFVTQEAGLLDLDQYFGPRIYGAQDNYQAFSKQIVIERILREHRIPGEQLLAIGDGYVEIKNTKEVGGLAVAVASDEAHNGSGRMDPWKRQRLLSAGADIVIPDYRDGEALLECLFGS